MKKLLFASIIVFLMMSTSDAKYPLGIGYTDVQSKVYLNSELYRWHYFHRRGCGFVGPDPGSIIVKSEVFENYYIKSITEIWMDIKWKKWHYYE